MVHGCASCGGLWLDNAGSQRVTSVLCSATLAAADAAAQAATHQPDTRIADVPCPVCRRPMVRRHVDRARVDLDDCGEHGTWFDRGELQTVARSVAAARAYGGSAGLAATQPRGGHLAGVVAAGAAVGVGAAAVGVAANPGLQQQARQHAQQGADTVGEVAVAAAELVDPGDVLDGVGVAVHASGELAGGAVELAGEAFGVVAEGAGGLLAGAFELIGAVFEGLG